MSDNHEHPVRELVGLCEPVHIGTSLLSPSPLTIRHSDSSLFLSLSLMLLLFMPYRRIYLLAARGEE
jgi:hypothetical protein